MPRTKPLVEHRWKNGAAIAVRVLKKARRGDPSDVIELSIKPARGNGVPARYWLNVADSLAICHALSAGATAAIIQGSPIEPTR